MKTNVRYSMVVLLLVILVITVGCTNATALINAIVASTEAVIPYIPQLSPADRTVVATYIHSAATITDTLLQCGSGVAVCVSKAVSEFNTLVLPTLSQSASPTIRGLLSAVSIAIATFVSIEGHVTTTPHKLNINANKRAEFRIRLTTVKASASVHLSH